MTNTKICSIPDCGKTHKAKGFCQNHWKRFLRNGDPLGGRPSHAELMNFVHNVALNHRGKDCLLWPYEPHGGRSRRICVDGRKTQVFRYVCELAHGGAPTSRHEVAHECGNGHVGCVAPYHLTWKTHVDNMADMVRHGTRLHGEKNGYAKLSDDDAAEIRRLRGAATQSQIAERFGIHEGTVGRIQRGERRSGPAAGVAT